MQFNYNKNLTTDINISLDKLSDNLLNSYLNNFLLENTKENTEYSYIKISRCNKCGIVFITDTCRCKTLKIENRGEIVYKIVKKPLSTIKTRALKLSEFTSVFYRYFLDYPKIIKYDNLVNNIYSSCFTKYVELNTNNINYETEISRLLNKKIKFIDNSLNVYFNFVQKKDNEFHFFVLSIGKETNKIVLDEELVSPIEKDYAINIWFKT